MTYAKLSPSAALKRLRYGSHVCLVRLSSGTGVGMAVEGAEGFGIADRGATLVLRASWFNRSSYSHGKEMAAISVYGCRAFTSPGISGFKP
ncbi:hypothetical protein B296_00008299 [Ensete ventricosum]|uniref:Uncharacterized protein n=1 Tax=Ensete ventricosum TaxID=4639 RepID=A0A427A8Y3_ENSVE|nr:hypothetical protein B296_00008299 [Ensete ventricosum]